MTYQNSTTAWRPECYGPSTLGRKARQYTPTHWAVICRSRAEIAAEELSAGDLVQLLADNFAAVFCTPMTGEHLTVLVGLYLCEFKKIPHGRPRCQMAQAWVDEWITKEWNR